MASINREEAQRRIAQDDGGPLDEVLLPRDDSGTVACYHARESCYTIPDDVAVDPARREDAQQIGRAPCKVCVLETAGKNRGQSLVAQLAALDPEDVGLTPFPDGGQEPDRAGTQSD